MSPRAGAPALTAQRAETPVLPMWHDPEAPAHPWARPQGRQGSCCENAILRGSGSRLRNTRLRRGATKSRLSNTRLRRRKSGHAGDRSLVFDDLDVPGGFWNLVFDDLDVNTIAQHGHDLRTRGHSRASGLPTTASHLPPPAIFHPCSPLPGATPIFTQQQGAGAFHHHRSRTHAAALSDVVGTPRGRASTTVVEDPAPRSPRLRGHCGCP
jgi:hypothetical protein